MISADTLQLDLKLLEHLQESTELLPAQPEKVLARAFHLEELESSVLHQSEAEASEDSKGAEFEELNLISKLGQRLYASRSHDVKRKSLFQRAVYCFSYCCAIPLLHPVATRIIEKLRTVESFQEQTHVLEGRLYMAKARIYLIRFQYGELSARRGLSQTFKKAVVAYRRALAAVPKGVAPSKKDLPALVEYARLARFGYQNRNALGISTTALVPVLKLGKRAAHQATEADAEHLTLQNQLQSALDRLSPRVRALASSSQEPAMA